MADTLPQWQEVRLPKGSPFSAEQTVAIRAALGDLCAWDPLRRSPQLESFLRYIVEARLRGGEGAIKAYSIAVDVFGRSEDFDPQSDPIVRVQARRLRALLADYYAIKGAPHDVRIALPRGRYVPEFIFGAHGGKASVREPEPAGQTPAETVGSVTVPRNRRALLETVLTVGGLAIVFIAVGLLFWPSIVQRGVVVPHTGQPRAPVVFIEEFENLADDAAGAPLVAGLAIELVTDINQFPHLEARYGGTQAQVPEDALSNGRPVYVLTGVVRRTEQSVQYGAVLSRRDAEAPQVSFDIGAPIPDDQAGMSIDDVSREIVMRLARPRGPLLAPARAWLDDASSEGVVLAPYPCFVAFTRYMEIFDPVFGARVDTCARAQLPDGDGAAQANAMLASRAADRARILGTDLPEAQELLAQAEALSTLATRTAPTRGFVWAQHAHVAWTRNDHQAARDRYNTAVQLNPADVAVLAHFATALAQTGNWALARQYSGAALDAEPDPPPRYYAVPAAWALREGDYAVARMNARIMTEAYPRMGITMMVAIGGQTQNSDLINTYLPRLLAYQAYRRVGIIPALRTLITDEALLRAISNGIARAGVPLDRLTNPF